jgi:hypothetical protein
MRTTARRNGGPRSKGRAEPDRLNKRAAALEVDLRRLPPIEPGSDDAEMRTLRRQYLARQLQALRARVGMLQGRQLTFDEESRELYDATAPRHTEAEFQGVLDELSARLPGAGPLSERYAAFRRDVHHPARRGSIAVFQAAIAACRERTVAHIALPADESFTVEYVTDKSWSGYNWYQGSYRSLIQVNTDLPIYIDRAIDLACHEGYPATTSTTCCSNSTLVRDRGWVEFTRLRALLAAVAHRRGHRQLRDRCGVHRGTSACAFERDVLFPLAGLDPSRAEEYYEVLALVDRLSYAGNEAARRYLDGQIDAAAAAAWLDAVRDVPPPQAEQRVQVLRPVPQLRHQLQPRQGSRARLRRAAGRRRRLARAPVDRVRAVAVVAAHCRVVTSTKAHDAHYGIRYGTESLKRFLRASS